MSSPANEANPIPEVPGYNYYFNEDGSRKREASSRIRESFDFDVHGKIYAMSFDEPEFRSSSMSPVMPEHTKHLKRRLTDWALRSFSLKYSHPNLGENVVNPEAVLADLDKAALYGRRIMSLMNFGMDMLDSKIRFLEDPDVDFSTGVVNVDGGVLHLVSKRLHVAQHNPSVVSDLHSTLDLLPHLQKANNESLALSSDERSVAVDSAREQFGNWILNNPAA